MAGGSRAALNARIAELLVAARWIWYRASRRELFDREKDHRSRGRIRQARR
jgi:hypothetical protein